jgi:hypothetical protein
MDKNYFTEISPSNSTISRFRVRAISIFLFLDETDNSFKMNCGDGQKMNI